MVAYLELELPGLPPEFDLFAGLVQQLVEQVEGPLQEHCASIHTFWATRCAEFISGEVLADAVADLETMEFLLPDRGCLVLVLEEGWLELIIFIM